ncbi:MAG: hypothetical protein KJ070_21060 [Verrucomicrobia bacterium]|nr:hypothetical protein [Verrucomicrobiota bacterium]
MFFKLSSVAVATFVLLWPVQTEGAITPLALSGTPVPGETNLVILNFGLSGGLAPTINNNCQAAFGANLALTNSGVITAGALFLAADGNLVEIVRGGNPALDLNGNFNGFTAPISLDDAGRSVIGVTYVGTFNGVNDNEGIVAFTASNRVQLAREQSSVPGYSSDPLAIFYTPVNQIVLQNNDGQSSFVANTRLTGIPGAVWILFRAQGTNLTPLFQSGMSLPDGNGTVGAINSGGSINGSGEVAFTLSINGSTNLSSGGLYRSDGINHVKLLRSKEPAPDGNGTFNGIDDATINKHGNAAFRATIVGSLNNIANEGIFFADGSSVTQVARRGQVVPGGNGTFSAFQSAFASVAFNDSNQVAFAATLTGTSGGSADNVAVYITTNNTLVQIARKGQSPPEGNGVFFSFTFPALNNKGQMAFLAGLSGTSGGSADDVGLYFVDESLNLHLIAREGQMLEGSVIQNLGLGFVGGANNGTKSGLNDYGQVGFLANRFTGSIYTEGLFLWTPDWIANPCLPFQLSSVELAGNDVNVTWQTIGGTTNVVQASSGLTGAGDTGFTNVSGDIVIPGTGSVTTNFWEIGGRTNGRRFYRIWLKP